METVGTLVVSLSCAYMLWCALDTFRIKARMTKRANEFDSDVSAFTNKMQQDLNYYKAERKSLEASSYGQLSTPRGIHTYRRTPIKNELWRAE